MEKKELSLQELIDLTSDAYISAPRSDESMYQFHNTGKRHWMTINIPEKSLGKIKGFLIEEKVQISTFIEDVLMREVKRREQQRGKEYEPVDHKTKLHYVGYKSPEESFHKSLQRFNSELKNIKRRMEQE